MSKCCLMLSLAYATTKIKKPLWVLLRITFSNNNVSTRGVVVIKVINLRQRGTFMVGLAILSNEDQDGREVRKGMMATIYGEGTPEMIWLLWVSVTVIFVCALKFCY